MNNHVMLDNVTHKNLRIILPVFGGNAGPDVNVARVFPAEFNQLQAEYPLLFVRNRDSGHFDAIALLGFNDDENLYLTEAGWDAGYVPLSIERQPFLIGFQEKLDAGVPEQMPVVHVDMDHPAVSETEGEPVFLPHGGESPLLQRMTSVLLTIHEGQNEAESLSQTLDGLELIETLKLSVEFNDGSRHGLDGLYTINEEKLASLEGSALETLHKKGYLQAAYMMLASLPNIAKLIARKNERLPK